VGIGAVMTVLAFVRYKKVERQIDEDSYQPSRVLDLLLVIAIMAVAVFLLMYLIHSI
jgi:putative membrane protein